MDEILREQMREVPHRKQGEGRREEQIYRKRRKDERFIDIFCGISLVVYQAVLTLHHGK